MRGDKTLYLLTCPVVRCQGKRLTLGRWKWATQKPPCSPP